MRYELTSLGPSGNGRDLIATVHEQAEWWDRLVGRTNDTQTYYGPHPEWVTMEGYPASPRMQRALESLCQQHQMRKSSRGVSAWRQIEPHNDDDHRRMATRAADLPRDEELLIKNATGELAKPRVKQ